MYNKYMRFSRARGGYTLIEITIVLAITVILSGILFTFSGSSRQQLALYTDEQKIVGLLNRAKTFALEKRQGVAVCAYGVHFLKPSTVILFRDLSSDPSCPPGSYDYLYDGSGEMIETLTLDPGVEIESFAGTGFNKRDVVFEPPYLTTYARTLADRAHDTNSETITLKISGTTTRATININPGGAIASSQ